MTQVDTTFQGTIFHRAVDAASEVGRLPAVPTIDWTHRLATSMVSLCNTGCALAMVGSIDSAGRIVQSDAAGAVLGLRPAGEGDGTDIALTVRSRAERIASLGLRTGLWGEAQGVSGLANDMVSEATWRDGPLGRLWEGIDVCDLLIGAVRLGSGDTSRMVLVQIASLPAGGARPRFGSDDRELLGSLLRPVHRRAVAALGAKGGGAIRWLTSREQQVLDQLKEGKTVRDIATAIDRSQHTVHDHVKSLHRKLNANSRGELVARALGHIIDEPTVAPTIRVIAAAGERTAASTVEPKTMPMTPGLSPASISGTNGMSGGASGTPDRREAAAQIARIGGYGQAARLDPSRVR